MMTKNVTSLRLPDSLLDEVDRFAEENKSNRTDIIARSIDEYIKKNKEDLDKISGGKLDRIARQTELVEAKIEGMIYLLGKYVELAVANEPIEDDESSEVRAEGFPARLDVFKTELRNAISSERISTTELSSLLRKDGLSNESKEK